MRAWGERWEPTRVRHNKGEVHVSDQTTGGVGAPEHPTTEMHQEPPAQYPGQPPADGGDAPTRAFAGFRTERRVPGSERQEAPAPPPAGLPPWDATPVTGIPRMDPTAYGAYYSGPAEAPPAESAAAPYRPEHVPHTPYPELSTGMLLRTIKPPPSEGWRRWLYLVSGRVVNLGESPRAARHNNLVASINRPLRGSYRVALLSLKGGVGKTTIAATLGSTFATVRGDRVVAVDANPDRGTLSQKIPLETTATVRQLLHDAEPSSATAMSAGTPRKARAAGSGGIGNRSGGLGSVQRRRLRPHPRDPGAGISAWCSPTAVPGCCTRRCRRCWGIPTC